MLDHNTGILSDPELANVIKKQILGEMSENKVLSAIFDGYMNNLPPGEKEVFLSHILSKKRTGSNLEPGENLRTILEAMGPFGIKVGQYLRASGILEERYSQHLKAFFDNALPPNRGQIISDVERALQQSGNLLAIGDRKGSGSINYFVEVQIRDPKSGQERNVGLRVHRSESEGRVAIQNQAWEDMIGDLNSSADSDVKDAAWALETARRNSMRTVGPGMVEHDLSREVENSRRASSIYDRSGTGDSPHIEALKIDEDLQRLLPAELQREFVITELVEHTPWEELSDLEKKKYGRAVVEAELRAVFQSGVFDPDTHPGNWLVDREFDNNRGRLVRIDYSQITEIPDSERISLANVVNEMLIPSHFERNRVRQLERNLSQILHLEGDGQIRQADIQQIINRTEYIALTDPINKLLFLVRELDRANPNGHVRLTDSSQDAISSLSRLMEYSEMVDEGDLRRILSEIVPGLKRKGVTDTVTRPFASPFQSSSSKGFCDAARKSLSPKP